MTKHALIENNVVTNTIVYNGEDFYQPPQGQLVLCGDAVGIGWHYINDEFINPNEE